MKFKKIISLLMVAILMLSLAACNNSGEKDQTTASTTNANTKGEDNSSENSNDKFKGKKITIGIWGGNDAESNALNKVKADFEAKTGATVDFKTYTDYNTQIQADFIGKTAPDVFYIDASVFPFYSELGVMEPLDKEEMGVSNYYSNLVEAFTATDGTLYCIPKDSSTLALYYNIDLLESVGMTPEDIPTDWENYESFLTDLQAKLDEVHGKGAVTAMTVNLELSRNLHLLERDGGSVSDENGGSTMNTPAIKNNLELILGLTSTGAYKTPAQIGLGWNGEVFGTGKTVLMDEGNWVYQTLVNDFSDINFGVTDMPAYKGTKSSMTFTVGYGISSISKEKELAKEWIKYATGTEGMATWAGGAGCLPSRPDVTEILDMANEPVYKVHTDQINFAIPWQKGNTITTIDNAYKNFIIEVVNGKITLEDALVQIDNQANSEISNAQ